MKEKQMSGTWKLPRREEKPKLRKTKIPGRNLTKSFRELLEDTGSNVTKSIKVEKKQTRKNKSLLKDL